MWNSGSQEKIRIHDFQLSTIKLGKDQVEEYAAREKRFLSPKQKNGSGRISTTSLPECLLGAVKISAPRFVALDTATISYVTENCTDLQVREMLSVFRGGEWIPYVTLHHLEEIACHESDIVFNRRFEFISNLPFVGYLRLPHEAANVGSIVDVQQAEIEFLADHLGACHNEVLNAVKPKMRNGYCSGAQFRSENLSWWEFFRENFAEGARRQRSDISNLTHFPTTDLKQRIPAPGAQTRALSEEGAVEHFSRLARRLEHKIRSDGDCRNIDPKAAAENIMWESLKETLQDMKSGRADLFEASLERDSVKRERLPARATVEDVNYEAVFVAQMQVYARRLGKSRDELLAKVRKEQMPSWSVWHELDSRIKQLPRAEIGNVQDKYIASFGVYVDLIDVDKRIAELLRQASKTNSLCLMVFQRVPKKRGIASLLDAMKAAET